MTIVPPYTRLGALPPLIIASALATFGCLSLSDSEDRASGGGTAGAGGTSVGDGSFPTGGGGGEAGSTLSGGSGGSGGSCVPKTCTASPVMCGEISDGCQGTLNCPCPPFQACTPSNACIGFEGAWSVVNDVCDVSLNDPMILKQTVTFNSGGTMQTDGKDDDCSFSQEGTYSLDPPDTINIVNQSSTCTANGCHYGSAQIVCNTTVYSPPVPVAGTIKFLDPNTLELKVPGTTNNGCSPTSTRTTTLTRL